MTRINVVPIEELHNLHLLAEYKELPRLFTLARNAQVGFWKRKNVPTEYTLGTGHVLFFYDKLQWAVRRYEQLSTALYAKGYNISPVPSEELLANISPKMLGDYKVTNKALTLNRERVMLRISEKPHLYK